jgi:hypothetical protein
MHTPTISLSYASARGSLRIHSLATDGLHSAALIERRRRIPRAPRMSDGFAHFVTQKGDRVKRVPLIKVRSTALRFQIFYVEPVLLYIESALDTIAPWFTSLSLYYLHFDDLHTNMYLLER